MLRKFFCVSTVAISIVALAGCQSGSSASGDGSDRIIRDSGPNGSRGSALDLTNNGGGVNGSGVGGVNRNGLGNSNSGSTGADDILDSAKNNGSTAANRSGVNQPGTLNTGAGNGNNNNGNGQNGGATGNGGASAAGGGNSTSGSTAAPR